MQQGVLSHVVTLLAKAQLLVGREGNRTHSGKELEEEDSKKESEKESSESLCENSQENLQHDLLF